MKSITLVLFAALVAAGACGKKAESNGSESGQTALAVPDLLAKGGEGAPATAGTPATAGEPGAATPGGETPAEAPAAEPQPSRLGFASGKVKAIDAEGTHEIAEGASLEPGTIVIVEPDSQAELDLPDGSVVDLDEMTEVLIRNATADGDVRVVDLAVLSGAIRVHAAPNAAEGSSFRVSTPTGTTEVKGTEYVLEVTPDRTATDVVVFDGRVVAKVGELTKDVTPVTVGTPAAVRLTPSPEVVPVPVEPVVIDRWDDWTDRQADELIGRYDIDIQAPEVIAAPVLVIETQPYWRPQIELRRARIVARAGALVTVAGPEKLVVLADPHARFVFAREAWVPVVYTPRHARLVVVHQRRLAVWQAAEDDREVVAVQLAPQLVELRGAWVEYRVKVKEHGRGHGRGHGREVVVVPGAPPPAVVVGAPGVVVGVPGVVVVPPAVTVVPPSVTVRVPGVGVHVGGAVQVGAPPPVVVPGVPPPVVVVPGGPPGPTIVVPGVGSPGHGRGHTEHGEGEGRGHDRRH